MNNDELNEYLELACERCDTGIDNNSEYYVFPSQLTPQEDDKYEESTLNVEEMFNGDNNTM